MKNRALFAFAIWAVYAALALWLTRAGVSLDTDSAMRLAQVRDLLHGQGWADTVQHRMNVPWGLPMHWSRLVDAPLALLMLVSEGFALRAWPLILFLPVLLLLSRLAFALGGRAASVTVLLLALLCTEIYPPFSPGDIDHHGLQLVLMLAALLGVVEQRPIFTAAAVTLGLGVGLESLPYALVALLVAALWLREDAHKACHFGVALAGMALLLLVTTTAFAYRAAPACDTYSLFYAALLMTGGAGVAGISCLTRRRLAALVGLAVLLLVLAAMLNPVCFAGPYAGMSAMMKTIFLARINEARPVWGFYALAPSEVIGGYGYAVFALAMCMLAPPGRARSLVMVFAATALLVATLQFRAVPFAILFALPGLAAALVRLLLARSIVLLAVGILLGSSGAFTLAASLVEGQDRVAQRVRKFHAQTACGEEQAMALLKTLPPGRVAGFVDQGPAILAYTPHGAIAGPYHRDADGIVDTYTIFTGAHPQDVLARRGITYLMTCRAAPDWDFYRARGGLMAQLAAGQVPQWLVPLGQSGDVNVYRFRP